MSLKAINTILVRVPKTHKDTVKCGEIDLYVDNRWNEVAHTIRYGEVVSSSDSRFTPGDTVYFHHNNVRRQDQLGEGGKEVEAPNRVLDEIFPISPEEIYGYERNGVFKTIPPYCFIAPIKYQEKEVNGIIIPKLKSEEDFIGIVKYGNQELEEGGILEGNTVLFRKNAKYVFHIYDERLFRMKNEWIIAKIEE
jgi:co-chaperonin GroES (HSP10)